MKAVAITAAGEILERVNEEFDAGEKLGFAEAIREVFNGLNMDAPKDVTGIPGSIEYFVGNWNIQERTGGRFPTTHALVDAFTRGDPYATHIWINSMRALAGTVATYINVLDPEAVIIGGGVARAGRALFDSLEEALRPIEWQPGGHKVKLVPAQLGEFAGAIGSAKNGLEELSKN